LGKNEKYEKKVSEVTSTNNYRLSVKEIPVKINRRSSIQFIHINKFVTNKLHYFLIIKALLHVLAAIRNHAQGLSVLLYRAITTDSLCNCQL